MESLEFHIPRFNELPRVPLYKDQVITYLENLVKEINIDNEEKIKDNINNLLESFDTCYYGDNTKILNEKQMNIVNCLNTIFENKKKCIALLNEIVNKYYNLDIDTALEYNKNSDIS